MSLPVLRSNGAIACCPLLFPLSPNLCSEIVVEDIHSIFMFNYMAKWIGIVKNQDTPDTGKKIDK